MRSGDIVDRANDLAEREREANVAAARERARASTPIYTGVCRFCEDEVPPPNTFCEGGECRDLFEKHEQARRRNGHR